MYTSNPCLEMQEMLHEQLGLLVKKYFGLENNPTMKHRTYSTVRGYPKDNHSNSI